MALNLYSVIAGVQPTQQDVLEAESFSQQILAAKFPDLDLREGTGIRDLLIRPNATLLAMIKLGVEYYMSQNNINNMDNVTDPTMVDSVLSNLFLERRTGTKSQISARIYFARSKNIYLPANAYFSTNNVLKFFPLTPGTYDAASMVFDSASNEYYLDVDLIAESEGSDYDIGSGSLLYFTVFDPYLLRAEVNYLTSASTSTETNLQFIDRARSGVSTRNLINTPSIISNLTTAFNFVTPNNVTVVGMGDSEMKRDTIEVTPAGEVNPSRIHIGGNVDIYCSKTLTTEITQLTLDANGDALVYGPIYKVTRSLITGGTDADTVAANTPFTVALPSTSVESRNATAYAVNVGAKTLTVTLANHGYNVGNKVTISGVAPSAYNRDWIVSSIVDDSNFTIYTNLTSAITGTLTCSNVIGVKDVGFSTRQVLKISLGIGNANKTASFVLWKFGYLDSIQTYLDDISNRVSCANYLARGFSLYSLDVALTCYDTSGITTGTALGYVNEYLASLTPGQPLILTELVKYLNTKGLTNVKLPLTVTFNRFTKDLDYFAPNTTTGGNTASNTGTITDVLDPNDTISVFVLNSLDVTTSSLAGNFTPVIK